MFVGATEQDFLSAQTINLGCPSMTIRCVKDGKWPSGIVGDIGKKEFCFSGFRCNQCEEQANTDECNLTFPIECEEACQAFAPIPF
ncbi:hypothetical protein [Phaffia rhodozyma]|uniref:Uncharacterized protein n=1 Tax=Phaffia rhodozyma TaxID=264483 RepID=A0A0F7STI5_PHARH|nr:hypothetical protein [Phaffia rhodozyma]